MAKQWNVQSREKTYYTVIWFADKSLQTNPRYRDEGPQKTNSPKTSGRTLK